MTPRHAGAVVKIPSWHPLLSLGFLGPKDDLDLVPAVALPFTRPAEAVSQEPLPSTQGLRVVLRAGAGQCV